MISARTEAALAAAYEQNYSPAHRYVLPKQEDHDHTFHSFLAARGYPQWYCEAAKTFYNVPRAIKESILKLYDGELQGDEPKTWDPERRRKMGQEISFRLAEDLLDEWAGKRADEIPPHMAEAMRILTYSLERDGYVYRNRKLQPFNE